jgi:hypothetical protein
LQFAKKKRKRSDSGSDCDLDATPPPSPKEDELIEKRRSSRNTNKRKKYVDDVDLNLSDDDNLLANLPADVAAEIKATGGAKSTNKEGGESVSASGAATPAEDGVEKVCAAAAPAEAPQITETSQSGPNYAFIVSIYRSNGYSISPTQ